MNAPDSTGIQRIGRAVLAIAGFCVLLAGPSNGREESKADFWKEQRKGANFFNRIPSQERFRSARELGLDFVRLVPDKWQGSGRDFLLGTADGFERLPEDDYQKLRNVLDTAHSLGHRIVLGMLSLPGARWRQNNDGGDDHRLWQSEDFQRQAQSFWRQLAGRLKDHPGILAYNPLNEPHPERAAGLDGAAGGEFETWLESRRGSPADLDRFYRGIVRAIREVDRETPILVEGYGHGSPAGLARLEPLEDSRILYSFHFYEPWAYTTKRVNAGRFGYPDRMPSGEDHSAEAWTPENLRARMSPVTEWAERHRIPASRIVVAEFGCDREVEGAREYLADVISLLNSLGFHWAFYSYREDVWDGMDYELGSEPGGGGNWDAVEQGRYRVKAWRRNPLFAVLEREFAR